MFYKEFHSQLFKRTINPNEKDFRAIVKAELLFRIENMKGDACTCTECTANLKKYKEYYQKMRISEG
jgi:hypothetical protein